ncbi:transporter substrate-binding domain-containing protein, partial [Streptomyces sp. NPDC012829]|uniref:transporter substrate-binding domain-containing protein n=1 Tax=Streptomyces sp. NPDC012829 TaxID=3364853 RepID=UPI00368F09C4
MPLAPRTPKHILRRGTAAAFVALAATFASACSGSGSDAVKVPGAPAATTAAGAGADAISTLVARERPADAASLPAGSTAAAIRKRGTLMVGGTQTAALFSLLDPATGQVDGFDAALSRLLAKYIIGTPRTKLVNVTAATREALLKNHSVDAVFATYTITPERAKVV